MPATAFRGPGRVAIVGHRAEEGARHTDRVLVTARLVKRRVSQSSCLRARHWRSILAVPRKASPSMKLRPVTPRTPIRIGDRDARRPKGVPRGDELKEKTKALLERLTDLQERLYAEANRSLLVVLQGRDTCGKDGTIRRVFDAVNPQGCVVSTFKKPSELELTHDYLWRIHH